MTDTNSDWSRRGLLLAGAAGGLAAAMPVAAQETTETSTIGGLVFEDRDDSGRKPDTPTGIADVLISNGRDVTRTGPDGRWTLPVRDGDSVFVIKPTGWMVPLEPTTNLPRFAVPWQPNGTPATLDLRYPGVPATPAPASIDFPLRAQTEPTRFDVLLLTDPQPESVAELGYVRDDVVAQLPPHGAAFGITHGDIMFDDLSLYDRSNRIIGSIGLPWWNCCGNHDMNYEATDNRYSKETFRRVYGARTYAHQYGGVTFVALDNVEYLGADASKPNGAGKYRGHFGEDQLNFVRNLIAQQPVDQLLIFSMHIPLRTYVGPDDPEVSTIDRQAFLQAISGRHALSFSGHTHTNEHHYFDAADGYAGAEPHHHQVLSAVSGSWWSGPFDARGIPVAVATDGSPNGFHVLSIDGASASTRLIPAHDPTHAPLRIMLDGPMHQGSEVLRDFRMGALNSSPIAREAVASTRLVVNLFDGGPRSTVEYALGTADEFHPMQRVSRPDPYVAELYARNAATKKPWVHAQASSHIWQAMLPTGLSAGAVRVAVRAHDEYGRLQTAAMILEVT